MNPSQPQAKHHANDLATRAWRKVIQAALTLGVILFVAAGTPRYWQGWMYVGIYTAGLCFNTAYFLQRDPALIERRLRAGPAAESSSSQRRIQAITALCLLSMFVVAGLDHRWSWSPLPFAASGVAALVFLAALAMIFVVFR